MTLHPQFLIAREPTPSQVDLLKGSLLEKRTFKGRNEAGILTRAPLGVLSDRACVRCIQRNKLHGSYNRFPESLTRLSFNLFENEQRKTRCTSIHKIYVQWFPAITGWRSDESGESSPVRFQLREKTTRFPIETVKGMRLGSRRKIARE